MTLSVGGRNLSEEPFVSTGARHRYMLCGWRTHSEIQLTGIPTLANDSANLDVVIEVGTGHSPVATKPISKIKGRFAFQHSAQYSLIKNADVADFEITEGRQIRI